ncbi:autotransporter domain-containing protein [Chlamydia serpentis]|nr:autotransporter domain-containing protein [Chlamydia serpentis]
MKILNRWICRRDLWVTAFVLTAVPTSFANNLVDIAGAPGMSTQATGVSENGEIIIGMKSSEDPFAVGIGFQYINGQLQVLEALDLQSSPLPQAITPDGSIIVGTSYNFMLGSVPVKWVNGKISRLPLPPGGLEGSAAAVSSDGSVIVGNGHIYLGVSSALKWDNEVITQLPAFVDSVNVYANGVTGDGSVIVGTVVNINWQETAVKWIDDQITPIGNLGGNKSFANAISTDGTVIVGGAETADHEIHAYACKNGNMVDLGTLGGSYSLARAVSSDGAVVVGVSSDSSYRSHAFRYADGKMVDLGTLGGSESYAQGLSGNGSVVVGKAQTQSGDWHAFMCRFQNPSPTPVEGNDRVVTSQIPIKMIDVDNTYCSLKNNQVKIQKLLTQHSRKLCSVSSVVPSLEYVKAKTLKYNSGMRNDIQSGTFVRHNSQVYGNWQQQQLLTGAFMDWYFTSAPKASVKVALSYGAQDAIVERATLPYTEQGLGKSTFSGFGGQLLGHYDFAMGNAVVMQPFMGIQAFHVNREGYAEQNVLFPVNYESVGYSAATGFIGAQVFASLNSAIRTVATLGLEQDLSVHLDEFAGSVSDLGSFVLENSERVALRPFASLAMYYELEKQQLVTLSVSMNQQPITGAVSLISQSSYNLNF